MHPQTLIFELHTTLSRPTPTNLGTTGITTLNPLPDFNYLQKEFDLPILLALKHEVAGELRRNECPLVEGLTIQGLMAVK